LFNKGMEHYLRKHQYGCTTQVTIFVFKNDVQSFYRGFQHATN
jgi:hypothetical protein